MELEKRAAMQEVEEVQADKGKGAGRRGVGGGKEDAEMTVEDISNLSFNRYRTGKNLVGIINIAFLFGEHFSF